MRKFCITCNTCISCNYCIYVAHLCLDQVSLAVNERTHMHYLEKPSSQEEEKQSLRGCERVPPQVSTGTRTRATIKALPAAPHLPRPYGC